MNNQSNLARNLTSLRSLKRLTLERVAEAGVDLADVFAVLEREGVEKFEKAWNELLETVSASVEAARA